MRPSVSARGRPNNAKAGAVFGGRLELNEDDDLDALARED